MNNNSVLLIAITANIDSFVLFTAKTILLPGDRISAPENDMVTARNVDEIILNSTNYSFGEYNGFIMNFTAVFFKG